MGLGMIVAMLMDASAVRGLLAPPTMRLLGGQLVCAAATAPPARQVPDQEGNPGPAPVTAAAHG